MYVHTASLADKVNEVKDKVELKPPPGADGKKGGGAKKSPKKKSEGGSKSKKKSGKKKGGDSEEEEGTVRTYNMNMHVCYQPIRLCMHI